MTSLLQNVLIRKSNIPANLLEFFESAECGQCYTCRMVSVFREVRRVLRDDGTCWVNIGDSYSSKPCADGSDFKDGRSNRGSRHSGGLVSTLKTKDLVGIPWRLAFALQADGWYLRQDIIWHKPNPMPESCRDRCTKAHEYIFLLTKKARYWYDADVIREPHKPESLVRASYGYAPSGREDDTLHVNHGDGYMRNSGEPVYLNPAGRNRRSVWTIPTQAFSEAHFATYPEALVWPCVNAGCPAQCCPECGKGWVRVTESKRVPTRPGIDTKADYAELKAMNKELSYGNRDPQRHVSVTETIGWQPSCKCGRTDSVPGVVFDPFTGSGTTGIVALKSGRRFVGTELKQEYIDMAKRRLSASVGLLERGYT